MSPCRQVEEALLPLAEFPLCSERDLYGVGYTCSQRGAAAPADSVLPTARGPRLAWDSLPVKPGQTSCKHLGYGAAL